jgi:hypothetical protein
LDLSNFAFNAGSNSLSKLDLTCLSPEKASRMTGFNVSLNLPMEIYLPEGYNHEVLTHRERSEKEEYQLWQLSLLMLDAHLANQFN